MVQWEEDFTAVMGEAPPEWMKDQMASPLIVARPGETLEAFYMRKYGPVTTTEIYRLEEDIRQRKAAGTPLLYWMEPKLARLKGIEPSAPTPAPQVIVAAGPDIAGELAGEVATVKVSGMEDLFKPEWEPEAQAGEGLGLLAVIAAAAMALGGG